MHQNSEVVKKKNSKLATKTIQKTGYFKQSDFPRVTLQEAQKIATGLAENFGNDGDAVGRAKAGIRASEIWEAWTPKSLSHD